MTRPARLRIPNELGQLRTLPDDVRPDDVRPDDVLADDMRPDEAQADGARPLPATFDVLPPRGQDGDAPAEVVVVGLGPNRRTAR